ncbi:hypothetical protein V5799_006764 [Amblyomma americanum]|uniref:Uncharacterized protein n=1 Tax=Amblyomma americanum TaxID=6943 RepID=A0AAQ4DVG6_AMBAM
MTIKFPDIKQASPLRAARAVATCGLKTCSTSFTFSRSKLLGLSALDVKPYPGFIIEMTPLYVNLSILK